MWMFVVCFSLAISTSVATRRRELQGDKSLTIDWSSFEPGHSDGDASSDQNEQVSDTFRYSVRTLLTVDQPSLRPPTPTATILAGHL
jgi:hypothetical protein